MGATKNCISHWFPLLEQAGLPVPTTRILRMGGAAQKDIWSTFDGKPTGGAFQEFIALLTSASESFSSPFFLRSGETAAKHGWKDTCFVEDNRTLASHVLAIAEFCACADVLGLPFHTWAIREFLSTPHAFRAFSGGMPVTEEWRVFVEGNRISCIHPYWPEGAIEGADVPDWKERLRQIYADGENNEIRSLAINAGLALGPPAWSVDVLKTERGYYVTDVALASMSWHWDECENDFRSPERMSTSVPE